MKMFELLRISVVLVGAALAASAYGESWQNFSHRAGFAEYYAAYPPSNKAATLHERWLLHKFQPRLFVANDQETPIHFYDDYIAHGYLIDAQGQVLAQQVTQAVLNQYTEASVAFVHTPTQVPSRPTAFGRVDYEEDPQLGRFTFLTYHFVFRESGLAAGLSPITKGILSLVADVDDWHQLDHYTAATIVLDESQAAVGLILQQHNNLRSYVLDADLGHQANRRVSLVAAKGSNELYVWKMSEGEEARHHRVVRFLDDTSLPYLVTGKPKPWLSAQDITEPQQEVKYKLAFIAQTDAFYRFKGYLGERRGLPGRDGPPGADYNALPVFKRKLDQWIWFNWQEQNTTHMLALKPLLTAAGRTQGASASLSDTPQLEKAKAKLRSLFIAKLSR